MSVERLPEAVYADATACRDREMPGVPPNPLPFWVSFPLLNKLPVPSVMPRRALFMHTCRMGETMWRTQENFDFDLTDPNLYTYPATLRYNSLYDKTLRGYFANPRVHKHLLRHGLVTRDGRVPCQLKEFNGFRHYLHRHNVRIVQTNHELHEPYIVKQMLKTAISSYREEQDRTCDITARFSRHLNLHAPPMEDENDQRLEEFLVDQGNTEGEVKWCKWLNRIYQEDCRKAALMRLRRIQDYVVKQRKIWVSWRKRNLFDLEWLAEEKRKAEDLERERLKHVAEHMRRTSVYQARMLERIRVASEEKAAEIHAMTIAVGKHICAKACRLWPLSARCPVGALIHGRCRVPLGYDDGRIDDLYYYVVDQVNRELSICPTAAAATQPPSPTPVTPKPAKTTSKLTPAADVEETAPTEETEPAEEEAEEEEEEEMEEVEEVPRSATPTTVLSQLVVKNAVELLAKNSRQRRAAGSAALERVGPPVDPAEMVSALETAVKDEINARAVDHPDLTLVMSDRVVAGAAEAEQVCEYRVPVDWDAAVTSPPHAGVSSDTSLYVAATVAEVVDELECEELMTPGKRELDAERRVAAPATGVARRVTAQQVAGGLQDGDKMLVLGTAILQSAHDTLPGGDDEDRWNEFSAAFVSGLVRRAFVQLRDSQARGQLGDEDVSALSSAVTVAEPEGDVRLLHRDVDYDDRARHRHLLAQHRHRHEALRAKVAERGGRDRVVSSVSLERMIDVAVERATKSCYDSADDVDADVRQYVGAVTQDFVDKFIEQIFAEMNVDQQRH